MDIWWILMYLLMHSLSAHCVLSHALLFWKYVRLSVFAYGRPYLSVLAFSTQMACGNCSDLRVLSSMPVGWLSVEFQVAGHCISDSLSWRIQYKTIISVEFKGNNTWVLRVVTSTTVWKSMSTIEHLICPHTFHNIPLSHNSAWAKYYNRVTACRKYAMTKIFFMH